MRKSVAREWKGQQVIIRLDGVLRGYELWLNNQLVGTWESGYSTWLFDLTLLKKAFKGEPQQLAMRVYSHFKGFEFDCFDDWTPMGIVRTVNAAVSVQGPKFANTACSARQSGAGSLPSLPNPVRHLPLEV